jgi:hypothetical protein
MCELAWTETLAYYSVIKKLFQASLEIGEGFRRSPTRRPKPKNGFDTVHLGVKSLSNKRHKQGRQFASPGTREVKLQHLRCARQSSGGGAATCSWLAGSPPTRGKTTTPAMREAVLWWWGRNMLLVGGKPGAWREA